MKKLLTLFTLLLTVCSGAWADNVLVVSNTSEVSETFADGSILYSIDNNGRVNGSTKFESEKDIVVDGVKTKGAALVDKRFAIKFPVVVSAVTIYGYNSSSGRTLNNVYTSTTMEKSSYTDITSSTTKNSSSTTPNYTYTFTASWATPIAANTAIWFEFNNACNFYKITYTSAEAKVMTPVITPSDGAMFSGDTQNITISSESETTIYYTIDGTTPSKTNGTLYEGEFSINGTTTVKAIAYDNNEEKDESNVKTATITKIIGSTYTFDCSEGKTIAELESAGWTFDSATFDGDPADTEKYVNLVSAMTAAGLTAPGSNSMEANALAFAKNESAYAMLDLGASKTIVSMTATLYGGSSSSFDQTIKYIGSDGSSVLKTYTNSLGAGNWKANAINKSERVSGVRYIKIYGATKWVVMTNFSVAYGTPTEKVTISDKKYATFASDRDLDFSTTDVKAYTAKVDENEVKLTKVDNVPASEGVILYCETPGTYNIPVMTSAGAVGDNEMVGVLVRTQVVWNVGEKYNYILQQGKFNKATDGYLKPNRAYLSTTYNVDAPDAKPLTIVFNDEEQGEETDGIKSVQGSGFTVNGEAYNLSGQRVGADYKGLVIINGKKVIRK